MLPFAPLECRLSVLEQFLQRDSNLCRACAVGFDIDTRNVQLKQHCLQGLMPMLSNQVLRRSRKVACRHLSQHVPLHE